MSDSERFQTEDLSSLHIHRTEIPNILLEMELDPYELSLYLHLKRSAGDKSKCFKRNKTLSKETKISERKIRYCKQALIKKNLIKITKRFKENGTIDTDLVQIIDLWTSNFIHFQKKFSTAPHAEGYRHLMPKDPAPHADKEDLINKNNIKKKESKPKKSEGKPSLESKDSHAHTLFSVEVLKILELLIKNILSLKADYKITDSAKKAWSNDIKLMLEVDNRPFDEVLKLMKWLETDLFWKKNTKSGKKLRYKFDDLWIEMNAAALNRTKSKTNAKTQPSQNKAIYERLKPIYDRYRKWFESSNDSCVLNNGSIVLTENCFYETKFDKGKYNLNYDKFINLLKTNYISNKNIFKFILNG